jgi:nicotinate-nucleotide pyrophosphorylase
MRTTATRHELERLLADDVPHGDLTTEALGISVIAGEMSFVARDAMVLALVEDAGALIELTGCEVDLHGGSGDVLKQGDPIPTARRRLRVAAFMEGGPNVDRDLVWRALATCRRGSRGRALRI